jgi:branched-chain amino acid transport system substrate-binding protein
MAQLTRRKFLGGASAIAAGAAAGPWVLRAHAQGAPIKIGLVLPYSGVYAVLGESITQAMELVFARENWTVAGRKIEMIKEDDEMQPPVGIRKTEKLIESDKVDILTGPVHSGILMGMRDKVHNSKTILIVSNAARTRSRATLLEVDLPHLLLELAALTSRWAAGWPRTSRRSVPHRAQLPGGQGSCWMPSRKPSCPAGGKVVGEDYPEARRDGLRALSHQDPPVGGQGGLRVLLGARMR